MLNKLSFRNVKKNFRNYSIYFITLVIGVCVFYMFNSIYAQKEVMEFTETTNTIMKSLQSTLSYVSVFVSIVLAFLIVYANNFFIRRRKKEIGVYLILGMDRKQISSMIVKETLIIGIFAMFFGIILGVFGSQFTSVFTAKIFEADMSGYRFIFSSDAVLKSIIYFGIIFIAVMIINVFAIGRNKLIDFIQDEKRNDEMIFKNQWVYRILFSVSIFLIGIAYAIIIKRGLMKIDVIFAVDILCGSIGTFLFFFSISGMMVEFIKKREHIYFKDLNMFIVRQLGNRINGNCISISIICIVLLLVIGIFSSGYSLQNAVSNDLKNGSPYDISIINYYNEGDKEYSIYDRFSDDIKNNDIIKEKNEITEYFAGSSFYEQGIDTGVKSYNDSEIRFIHISDYNKMMELSGKEKISVRDGEYKIIAVKDIIKEMGEKLIKDDATIVIDGEKLKPSYEIVENNINNNLYLFTFIVGDSVGEDKNPYATYLNINYKDGADSSKLEEKFKSIMRGSEAPFVHFESKTDIYNASISTKAVVSFLSIYIGIVFMIVCVAILAIQQLSEASDNRERYIMLNRLGVDRKMINKAVFIQILCYFAAPMILAFVHSIVGIKVANEIIKVLGQVDVIKSMVATTAIIIAVYGIYFIITYMGSKKIVMEAIKNDRRN